jgi:hypothetical protein
LTSSGTEFCLTTVPWSKDICLNVLTGLNACLEAGWSRSSGNDDSFVRRAFSLASPLAAGALPSLRGRFNESPCNKLFFRKIFYPLNLDNFSSKNIFRYEILNV